MKELITAIINFVLASAWRVLGCWLLSIGYNAIAYQFNLPELSWLVFVCLDFGWIMSFKPLGNLKDYAK